MVADSGFTCGPTCHGLVAGFITGGHWVQTAASGLNGQCHKRCLSTAAVGYLLGQQWTDTTDTRMTQILTHMVATSQSPVCRNTGIVNVQLCMQEHTYNHCSHLLAEQIQVKLLIQQLHSLNKEKNNNPTFPIKLKIVRQRTVLSKQSFLHLQCTMNTSSHIDK